MKNLLVVVLLFLNAGYILASEVDSELIDSASVDLAKDSICLKKTSFLKVKKIEKKDFLFTKTGNLICRERATRKSKIIKRLKRGTRVRYLSADSTLKWTKVEFFKDSKGWIATKYLTSKRKEALPSFLRACTFKGIKKKGNLKSNPKRDVKGLYLTIYSATGKMINKLIKLADQTEVNAFVIDVKDDAGRALFHLKTAEKYAPSANKYRTIKDIKKLIKRLHEHNIYVIARIVSFKDPQFAKYHKDELITFKNTGKPYKSSDGLIWVTAYNRNLWDYDVGVAKECAEAGFNEIQFDYVRFPAAKNFKNLDLKNTLNETKAEAVQGFLMYAYDELYKYPVYISADIYGLVPTNEGDLSIGQNWEAISSVVDYICPMMYPSHYYNGSFGIKVPDKEPYNVVYHSVRDAVERNYNIDNPAIVRPWFQAFTAVWLKERLSYNKYNIHEQMRAANKFGITGYLLWNAANRYYRAYYTPIVSQEVKDSVETN